MQNKKTMGFMLYLTTTIGALGERERGLMSFNNKGLIHGKNKLRRTKLNQIYQTKYC